MSEYQIAPIPDNEAQRLDSLRTAMCAYVPHEDRFDRITRMAQRLMQVPMALISIVEEDTQWFRSAQGLNVPETHRNMSFCSHAILTDGVFQVNDTKLDPRFTNNPLVLGYPFIRSYCGWPLELAPGLRVGTLCVLDTLPRFFTDDDIEILSDLAHMVETELRINAISDHQKAMLMDASREQRKLLLDPLTGNWSVSGFDALIERTLDDVAKGNVFAALCGIKILNANDFTVDAKDAAVSSDLRGMLISQMIRKRLPANAVLCCLPGGLACALLAAHDRSKLDDQITLLSQEPLSQPIPGIDVSQKLAISTSVLHLEPAYTLFLAIQLRGNVMSKFKNA
jgi:hypothetical protein